MQVTLAQFLAELLEWKGTPYSDAIFGKRKGVNCIKFFCAVEDFCHGFDPSLLAPIPNLPAQTSEHDAKKSWEVVKFVVDRYRARVVWKPGDIHVEMIELHPGDAVLTGNKVGTPAHILIAGPDPTRLWHAYNDSANRVTQTSIGWCVGRGILRIYRPCGSGVWL